MPLEAELPNEKQPRAEAPTIPSGASRAPKPLGRGLEQISHLFLSPSAATRSGEPTGDRAPERAPVRPAARAGVAVLRPGAPLTKDQLMVTLSECRTALEADMGAIAAGVSCSPYGEIDLLGLDHAHQLTVIDVEIVYGDGLLLRGLSHVDWIARNLSIVQRLYQGWAIDSCPPPRLFLVAPRFSLALQSAIRQIARPAITCFSYRDVALAGGTGLLVERLGGEGESTSA